eukprot:scaffold311161_cov22-Tisochrysis_lutea.AAC.1
MAQAHYCARGRRSPRQPRPHRAPRRGRRPRGSTACVLRRAARPHAPLRPRRLSERPTWRASA